MADLTAADRDDLEAMIDRSSLADVLIAIAEVCNGKGEHLRSNWQDANAAREWEKNAAAIDKLSYRLA